MVYHMFEINAHIYCGLNFTVLAYLVCKLTDYSSSFCDPSVRVFKKNLYTVRNVLYEGQLWILSSRSKDKDNQFGFLSDSLLIVALIAVLIFLFF